MATSAMGSRLGNTLNARPESESGTESQHVVVYVRRRERSGDEGRVLSVGLIETVALAGLAARHEQSRPV